MKNTLDDVINDIQKHWRGLDSYTVEHTRTQLQKLTHTSVQEPWLARLFAEKPQSQELHRDAKHGFILLAHFEKKGLYRAPHNHGAGWVFYALHSGEMRVTTYKQITSPDGDTTLVSRGANVIQPSNVTTYLPGDIHDTECLSDWVLMFRLTSCDFQAEKQSGRLIQFKDHTRKGLS
ncbi:MULTISPECIES: hypothetical protein [Pseudoalteromonas]|uniref:Cysteine dioxygenase n=1 Tax=Pseudoalteromonas amylolytica TaxID=1859457 RepID=A0A1S1N0B6_9GAMM|nr:MULTISPECIES: hypothetical protein [Pseudoalteromonas]OHU90525.1 hypothetical protein BFC16_02655 [Pseudoalteromonas sp. JW3]OHU92853.1 hypothetical protein BET10_05240 [Pseudoalteromonas amylolytica]